ncbi:MAG TPA: acyl-CoA dehydrogenase, partial [Dongiaceae bacterium]|nr:acyl-CoA dehydrogenase [Dongiaceae bacterium]
MKYSSELLPLTRRALEAAETLLEQARAEVLARTDGGTAAALEREQFAAHALAWYATYAAALRQMLDWAGRLDAAGRLEEREQLILRAAFGEYLAQLAGGLAMSQGEIARPADLGIAAEAAALSADPAVARLTSEGNTDRLRRRLAELIA